MCWRRLCGALPGHCRGTARALPGENGIRMEPAWTVRGSSAAGAWVGAARQGSLAPPFPAVPQVPFPSRFLCVLPVLPRAKRAMRHAARWRGAPAGRATRRTRVLGGAARPAPAACHVTLRAPRWQDWSRAAAPRRSRQTLDVKVVLLVLLVWAFLFCPCAHYPLRAAPCYSWLWSDRWMTAVRCGRAFAGVRRSPGR